MEIRKKTDSFNMYTLTVSYGELTALKQALGGEGHSGVEADEMLAAINWYLANTVPGPGEDKEDLEARLEQPGELDGAELASKSPIDADFELDSVLDEPPKE